MLYLDVDRLASHLADDLVVLDLLLQALALQRVSRDTVEVDFLVLVALHNVLLLAHWHRSGRDTDLVHVADGVLVGLSHTFSLDAWRVEGGRREERLEGIRISNGWSLS